MGPETLFSYDSLADTHTINEPPGLGSMLSTSWGPEIQPHQDAPSLHDSLVSCPFLHVA